jgi:hypothetical protein
VAVSVAGAGTTGAHAESGVTGDPNGVTSPHAPIGLSGRIAPTREAVVNNRFPIRASAVNVLNAPNVPTAARSRASRRVAKDVTPAGGRHDGTDSV